MQTEKVIHYYQGGHRNTVRTRRTARKLVGRYGGFAREFLITETEDSITCEMVWEHPAQEEKRDILAEVSG